MTEDGRAAEKAAFRKAALKRRAAVENRAEKSAAIANALRAHSAYRNAERIFAYLSCRSEVRTDEIIRQIWQDHKIAAVPRVEGDRMVFCRIVSMEDLCVGYRGIREPKPECPVLVPSGRDLILVPGTAFDRRGYRMGYGGGYYDRFLSMIPDSCVCAGLAFPEQIADEIPVDSYDCRLDIILTGTKGDRND